MSNQESSTRSPAVLTVYSSWDDVRKGLNPGEVLHIERGALPHPEKVGMKRATNTLHGWTSKGVYRDNARRDSLRVYDCGDYLKATVFNYNPDVSWTAAAYHAIADAPTKTALALSIGFGAYQTLRKQETQTQQEKKQK